MAWRFGCATILGADIEHAKRLGGAAFINLFAADAALRPASLLEA